MGNNLTPEESAQELSTAAEEGQLLKVKKLIDKGADPNRKISDGERNSRTSLHRAAKTKNNVEVLSKLLGHIKDVDATDDEGNTALHLAAGFYNNEVFVRTLLQAKPNCKIQNIKGQTALHSAIEGGNDIKIIELLLQGDCDPNVADFEGNTALHLCAIRRGIEPMIPGVLLRFGANPNLKNDKGQTALHLASVSGNKTVLLLLKFHAKVRIRDKEGNKASDVAATEEIRDILLCEEEQLEEKTYRIKATPPITLSQRPSVASNDYTEIDNYHNKKNQLELCYGPHDSHHYWKGSGGDGVIHLPDNTDIVVPPQTVPRGTVIKLKISPSEQSSDNIKEDFDFDNYNITLDMQLTLPGNPYQSSNINGVQKQNNPADPSLAFTGMCIEGCNRWKSTRELKTSYDGTVAVHLNLTREKTKPLAFKGPSSHYLSMVEVNLDLESRNLSVSDSTSDENSVSSLSNEEKEVKCGDTLMNNQMEISSESSLSDSEKEIYHDESTEKEEPDRYDRHPIDPELATIEEEISNDFRSTHSDPDEDKNYEEKLDEPNLEPTPPHVYKYENEEGWIYDSTYWEKLERDDKNLVIDNDVTTDDLANLEFVFEGKKVSQSDFN